jgi:hypothetical protein
MKDAVLSGDPSAVVGMMSSVMPTERLSSKQLQDYGSSTPAALELKQKVKESDTDLMTLAAQTSPNIRSAGMTDAAVAKMMERGEGMFRLADTRRNIGNIHFKKGTYKEGLDT